MNKFQKGIKFRDVEEFLDFLPEEEREITEILRELILDTLPDLKEKLAYNVPFYYRQSRIAYIWPASIPWGGSESEGVQLGFTRGAMMSDPEGIFKGQTGREMRKHTFQRTGELNANWIRNYLFEAMEIDEVIMQEKRLRKKQK